MRFKLCAILKSVAAVQFGGSEAKKLSTGICDC